MTDLDSQHIPSGHQKQQLAKRIRNGDPSSSESEPAVRVSRERMPLASREGSVQQRAQDVEGLKDYRLGECLGKGAFGSVYKSLCMDTGETVAIKQVDITELPKNELKSIMVRSSYPSAANLVLTIINSSR